MGLSASRINIVINTLLASMLVEGAISYLNYAYRLMHFPLGVFAVALGTVTLPKVSEHAAQKKMDELIATYDEAMGLTMFLVIPSAVFLAGFGTDLVRLIFERGAFNANATMETSRALFFYAFGLVGFAGVRVAAPVFYALGDSRRPMYYSITAVLINIILNFPFIKLWGFAGLAAATSAAGLANIFLLGFNIRKRIPEINYAGLLWRSLKITVAAVLAFLAVHYSGIDSLLVANNIWRKIAVVSMQIAGMGLVYLFFCRIFRVEEIYRVKDIFKFKK
jgi:putative peptidoglycan lipid II flippase